MAKATQKVVKSVAGRVDYVGRFEYGDGRKAVKAVLNVDEAFVNKYGPRVECIFFRQGLQELLMDAELNSDGSFTFGGKHLTRDDHLAVKGEYNEKAWKQGKKSGINRTFVVSSKADLVWQRIQLIEADPWATGDSDQDSPLNDENSPV